jgi:hypothetical protein
VRSLKIGGVLKEVMVMNAWDMVQQIIIADIITGCMIMVMGIQTTTLYQGLILVGIPVCIDPHIEVVMNYVRLVIPAQEGHRVLIWVVISDIVEILTVLANLIVPVIRQLIHQLLDQPVHPVLIYL